MTVIQHGTGQAGPVAGGAGVGIAVSSLHPVPAEVEGSASAGCSGADIDFLEGILSHVANVQIAIGTVEAEPPWIAETIAPDLAASRRTGGCDEGIVRWNPIGRAAIQVDSKDLAKESSQTLAVSHGIAAASPIT